MNFKNLDTPDQLLNSAFARGRKKAGQYAKQQTPFYTMKGKEIAKIDASAEYLMDTLKARVIDFPSLDKLPEFYQDLISFIIDIDKMKKSLAKFSGTAQVIKDLRRTKIIALKELKFERGAIPVGKKISNEYFGRVSSVVKRLEKDVKVYNDAIKLMRELPSIKTDEEVFILAGLPNAGKSTLLGKITDSQPRVAAFPFTTKGLNVGKFFKNYLPVQVIDTPGLLDRDLSKRNKIELKAISAFQHLEGTIIFVIDPTHSLSEQKHLFDEIKKLFSDKGFMVVINKTDIASEAETKAAQREFKDQFVILEGEGLTNLRDEIVGKKEENEEA
jgi:nucleolar GTP-binding protein